MSKTDSLNQWIKSQPLRQTVMLIGAIVIGILLLMYLVFAIPMEDNKARLEGELSQAQRKLQALESKQLTNEIKALQEILTSTKTQIQELKTQAQSAKSHIDSMPELRHDNQSWADVLEKLLQYSVELDVEIAAMEIASPQSHYIGILNIHKLLHVEGNGSFLSIEKWIRYAEDMPKTMKLKTVRISEGETPSFIAEFEVLGLMP